MFYTNYKIFKESLSGDVKFDAKKQLLINKINRLRELNNEIETNKENLTTHNKRVREILGKIKTHSIIVDGILVEIYDNYMSNRFNEKEFFDTIDKSVDTLGADVKEMVDKYKEIYQYQKTFSFTRANNNKDGRPTGSYTKNENFIDTVKNGLLNLVTWAKSFFTKAENNLEMVKNNLATIGIITESNVINEQVNKHLIDQNITKWMGKSKYKKHIIDVLATVPNAMFKDLHVFYDAKNGNYGVGTSNTMTFLNELIYSGLLIKTKNGRNYIYTLTTKGADVLKSINVSVTIKPTQETETLGTIPYDPAKPVEMQQMIYDESYLAEALQIASDAIKTNKEKLKLEAEEEMLKKEIVDLYKELNLLEVVIDDKVHKLYTQTRTYLNATEFQKTLTTAEEVGEEVADLMTDLIAEHVKEFEVSGSVRYFDDTSKSKDGELGAHFDHETKTVVTKEGKINENILKRAFNWIKRGIKKIISVRHKVERKLATI